MRTLSFRLLILLSFLFLLPMNHQSWAQNPTVTGAQMTWYGIYTATSIIAVDPTKDTSTGISPPASNSDHIVLTAAGGLFGYGYTLSGSPSTATVSLTYKTIFPNGSVETNVYDGLPIGSENLWIGTNFRSTDPTGTWTLQLWYGQKMLLEKSFTVVNP
jgi:hypothetical protein